VQCKAYRKANNPAFTDTARIQYAQQGLCNGRNSGVRPSVCLSHRSAAAAAAGGFAAELHIRAGNIVCSLAFLEILAAYILASAAI